LLLDGGFMTEEKASGLVCRYLRLSLACFGLLALVVNGYTLWAHYRSAYGAGGWGVPGLELVLWLCMAVVVLTAFSLAGLFLYRVRCASFAILVGGVVYIAINLMTLMYAERIRMAGFARLADESQPLVSAIEEYSKANGQPPETLADLDLPAIEAGLDKGFSLPDYRYLSGYLATQRFHGNPWVLVLDTPTGSLQWDHFVYYPLQNYPSLSADGWVEPVNGWAYVHQ
jgi:hypothetical protein